MLSKQQLEILEFGAKANINVHAYPPEEVKRDLRLYNKYKSRKYLRFCILDIIYIKLFISEGKDYADQILNSVAKPQLTTERQILSQLIEYELKEANYNVKA